MKHNNSNNSYVEDSIISSQDEEGSQGSPMSNRDNYGKNLYSSPKGTHHVTPEISPEYITHKNTQMFQTSFSTPDDIVNVQKLTQTKLQNKEPLCDGKSNLSAEEQKMLILLPEALLYTTKTLQSIYSNPECLRVLALFWPDKNDPFHQLQHASIIKAAHIVADKISDALQHGIYMVEKEVLERVFNVIQMVIHPSHSKGKEPHMITQWDELVGNRPFKDVISGLYAPIAQQKNVTNMQDNSYNHKSHQKGEQRHSTNYPKDYILPSKEQGIKEQQKDMQTYRRSNREYENISSQQTYSNNNKAQIMRQYDNEFDIDTNPLWRYDVRQYDIVFQAAAFSQHNIQQVVILLQVRDVRYIHEIENEHHTLYASQQRGNIHRNSLIAQNQRGADQQASQNKECESIFRMRNKE